jgi:hypothetical protein
MPNRIRPTATAEVLPHAPDGDPKRSAPQRSRPFQQIYGFYITRRTTMTAYDTDPRPDTARNRSDYTAPPVSNVAMGEDMRFVMMNRVAWGPVWAGVAMILVVQLVLNLGGLGIGFASSSSDATGQVSSNFSMGAAIWWTITGIIASYIGGYASGRLSGDPVESTTAWHGLTSWAVSVIILACFIMAGAGAVMGGVLNTAGIYNNTGMTYNPAMTNPNGQNAQNPGTANPNATNAPAVPPARAAQTAPDQTSGAATENPTTVSTKTAAGGAAFWTAIALILAGIAAWFGGRTGCIKTMPALDKSSIH